MRSRSLRKATVTGDQGLLDVFVEPYAGPVIATVVYCGCCGDVVTGYGAIHDGHNTCHRRDRRGLGCECVAMSLTLNQTAYQIRRASEPTKDKCWCCGDPRCVCGTAKRGHPQTRAHSIDQLMLYYVPRVYRVWPASRHRAIANYLDAWGTYFGVIDDMRGEAW